MQITSSLFSDVTQARLVISYRRFGTTHRSHLQVSSIPPASPLKTGWIGCAERSVTTDLRYLTSQESEDLKKCCKVKCTLVHALRLCTGRTAHRESRGIALLFHDHGTRRRWGQRHAPAALYARERHGTNCTGGWVNSRAGLDRSGKSRTYRDSIPGLSST